MEKLILFFFLFFCFSAAYPINIDSINTGYIGGITLFDESSPYVGINNPALLTGYGLVPGTATNKDPEYRFGRIFIANPYFSLGLSEDSFSTINSLIKIFQGSGHAGAQSRSLINGIKFLTFGMVDLSPIFSGQTPSTIDIVNAYNELIGKDKIGFYGQVNANFLSFYRNNLGISLYGSIQSYGGFFGDKQNVLIANDPAFHLNGEAGLAVSIGRGQLDLPVIQKINLGYTIRAYYKVQVDCNNYFDFNDFINTYNTNRTIDPQFGKYGYGASFDLGLTKAVSENFLISAKISDILSPIYWTSAKSFGWEWADLSLGLKYVIPAPHEIRNWVDVPSVYAQIDDLFYTHPVSFLAKLHLGVDSRFLFDIIQIGAGLNAGYPTAGITIHLSPWGFGLLDTDGWKYLAYGLAPISLIHIKLNFTVFGKEMGRFPGEAGMLGYSAGGELYWGF